MIHGEVKVWYMTEEERLAYIKKHPIRPADESEKRGSSFSDLHTLRRKKDYKWRSEPIEIDEYEEIEEKGVALTWYEPLRTHPNT